MARKSPVSASPVRTTGTAAARKSDRARAAFQSTPIEWQPVTLYRVVCGDGEVVSTDLDKHGATTFAREWNDTVKGWGKRVTIQQQRYAPEPRAAAAVSARRPKCLTKRYGVLVADRLVFQSDDYRKASGFIARGEGGVLTSRFGSTPAEERRTSREIRERQERTNPLAQQLALQQSALLEAIHVIGDGVFELETPDGIIAGRRATDAESAQGKVTFSFTCESPIDVRGDSSAVATAMVGALQSLLSELQAVTRDIRTKASAIQQADKQGTLPRSPVTGYCVMANGDRVDGPIEQEHLARTHARACGGNVVRIYEDGTVEERGDPRDVVFT